MICNGCRKTVDFETDDLVRIHALRVSGRTSPLLFHRACTDVSAEQWVAIQRETTDRMLRAQEAASDQTFRRTRRAMTLLYWNDPILGTLAVESLTEEPLRVAR